MDINEKILLYAAQGYNTILENLTKEDLEEMYDDNISEEQMKDVCLKHSILFSYVREWLLINIANCYADSETRVLCDLYFEL